jgi:peroxiredoxin Q/BCP
MHPLEQKPAPAFSLLDQDGNQHTLEQYLGKWVVLYFYPRDMTPGCTVEACSFRDANEDITKLGAVVLGVSADTETSHKKFASKHSLTFKLLADKEGSVSKAYGAYGQKKFMGRNFEGIYRNTYLINPEGIIVKVYQGVKPAQHVAEIMADLTALQK